MAAGNAIAWKEEYAPTRPVRRVSWMNDAWHLLKALRLMVAADRMEAREQVHLQSRLK